MSYNSVVLADSPVGYWRLGESSGTTAEEEINNKDGTYQNSPSLGLVGLIAADTDTGVLLDRSSSQYVTVSTFSGVTGSNPRTFEALIARDGVYGFHPIMSQGQNTTGARFTVGVYTDGLIGVSVSGGFCKGSTDVDDGEPHHIAVVVPSGATDLDEILIYVDGYLETMSYPYSVTLNTGSGDFEIGHYLGASDYFGGMIDEVAVYDKALSAAEILEHAEAAFEPPTGSTSPEVTFGYAGSLHCHKRGRIFWDADGDLSLWYGSWTWVETGSGLGLFSGLYEMSIQYDEYGNYASGFPYADYPPARGRYSLLRPNGVEAGRYVMRAEVRRTWGLDLYAGIGADGVAVTAYGYYGNTGRVAFDQSGSVTDPRAGGTPAYTYYSNAFFPTSTEVFFINGVDAEDITGHDFLAGMLGGLHHDIDDTTFYDSGTGEWDDCIPGIFAATEGLYFKNIGIYDNGYFEVRGLTPGWKVRLTNEYDATIKRTGTADILGVARFNLIDAAEVWHGAQFDKLEILNESSVVQETILASQDSWSIGFCSGDIWATYPSPAEGGGGLMLSLYV